MNFAKVIGSGLAKRLSVVHVNSFTTVQLLVFAICESVYASCLSFLTKSEKNMADSKIDFVGLVCFHRLPFFYRTMATGKMDPARRQKRCDKYYGFIRFSSRLEFSVDAIHIAPVGNQSETWEAPQTRGRLH